MNAKLKEALARVALTSQSASELVEKIVSKNPDDDISSLKKQIESLTSQITALQLQLQSSTDSEFTEDDATQLYETFRVRLKELATAQLARMYGRSFFAPLSPPVRKVMAKALIDETESRSSAAQTLWITIFSNGEL